MSKDTNALKTILVIDDDDVFRETLCSGLETSYLVVPAANAKEAIGIIGRTKIDLILTDVRMPGMSGYELIEWVNSQTTRGIPYVVMTGYLNLIEMQQEEGRHTFKTIPKPFKLTDVKKLIDGSLAESDKKTGAEVSHTRFCKVPINDIVLSPILDFDIFLQLSEQNFVKVAYKDEEIPLAQIKKFKQKGVQHLYIRKDDFHKFVQFTFDFAKTVTSNPSISLTKKLAFLDYANKVMMEQVYSEGLDKDNFESVASFVELSVGTVLESHEVLNLLEVLKDVGDHIYCDSFAAALYSVLIAREMKYESALTAFKLCIAGVFQDIGKKEIEKDIVDAPIANLSNKELRILETHVIRSQKILESVKCIHSDIIRIIQEHHEDLEGKGYPFGKRKPEQHPLSRILQCSNVFIDHINEAKSEKKTIDVAAVLSDIEKNYKTRLDADCVKALRTLFKVSAVGAEA